MAILLIGDRVLSIKDWIVKNYKFKMLIDRNNLRTKIIKFKSWGSIHIKIKNKKSDNNILRTKVSNLKNFGAFIGQKGKLSYYSLNF